jgi:hypothetical protein
MPKIDTLDELMDRAKVAQQAIRDLNLNLIEAHDRVELQKLDRAIDTLDTLSRDIDPEAAAADADAASAAVTAPPVGLAPPEPIAAAPRAAAPARPPAPAPRVGVPAAAAPHAPGSAVPAPRPAPPRPAPTEATPVRPANVQAARPAAPKPVITPSTAPTSFQEQISKGIYTRRIGRVFATGAGMGMVPIGKLPHRDGLPAFDNCLAPDDTPVDGAYGVFVSSTAVFAAVLRRPFDSHRWKVIETIDCKQQREIVDAVAHLLRRPTTHIRVDD